MEVVVGRYAGQILGDGRMLGDAVAHPKCMVKTPDHDTFQVHSCLLGRGGIGRSSVVCFNACRHEKTFVRCPC